MMELEMADIYKDRREEREMGNEKGKHLNVRKMRRKDKSVQTWIANLVCVFVFLSSDTAYVRIFISDVNDNKPVFAQSVYEVDVDEDADVGSTVLTVSANDEDEGR